MSKLFSYLLLGGLLSGDSPFGMRKGDRSTQGLPYFPFEHNGRKYNIQAVNETAAKAKFDKIISKNKS